MIHNHTDRQTVLMEELKPAMADIAETERRLVEFLNGVLKGNVLHILTSTTLPPFPHKHKPPVHQPNMIEWIKRRLAPFLNGVLKGKVLRV